MGKNLNSIEEYRLIKVFINNFSEDGKSLASPGYCENFDCKQVALNREKKIFQRCDNNC